MDVYQREWRLTRAVKAYPEPLRAFVLRTLMATPAERAAVIGRLHAKPQMREIAELLIDLEERRDIALEAAGALEGTLPPIRQ